MLTGGLVWVALVSVVSTLMYFWTSTLVGRLRGRLNIPAPAMTGTPEFERAVRVQGNTLEQIVPFLVALWLCALAWNPLVATGLGVVWIAARILYALAYMKDPAKRGTGFVIALAAFFLLTIGALYGLISSLMHG